MWVVGPGPSAAAPHEAATLIASQQGVPQQVQLPWPPPQAPAVVTMPAVLPVPMPLGMLPTAPAVRGPAGSSSASIPAAKTAEAAAAPAPTVAKARAVAATSASRPALSSLASAELASEMEVEREERKARTIAPSEVRPRVASKSSEAAGVAYVPATSVDDQLLRLTVDREINAIALSADNRSVALGLQDHSLQVWDLQMAAPRLQLKGHRNWVTSVAYSPDGQHVASGSSDKTVKVWNLRTGNCQATLQGHILSVVSVAYSDDGKLLASGSWDKTVRIWEVQHGERLQKTLQGHTDWVHCVAWAPGGRILASASSDHSVRVWNCVAGLAEQVLVGHSQTVTSVCFASNGAFLASGSLDRSVRVWSTQDGSLVARLQQQFDEGSVHSLVFSIDCERIIVGGSDKLIKVWNFKTGEPDGVLVGHEEAVLGVATLRDGQRIVSCSHDKTVRVWRMPERRSGGQDLLNYRGAGGVSWHLAGAAASRAVERTLLELREKLRCTEQTNLRLRNQLQEAQAQMAERRQRDLPQAGGVAGGSSSSTSSVAASALANGATSPAAPPPPQQVRSSPNGASSPAVAPPRGARIRSTSPVLTERDVPVGWRPAAPILGPPPMSPPMVRRAVSPVYARAAMSPPRSPRLGSQPSPPPVAFAGYVSPRGTLSQQPGPDAPRIFAITPYGSGLIPVAPAFAFSGGARGSF
eukprot:TRINITY_DN23062_c0_g3_i1.p1 TRINITY_DN23062_c0_g3~~TRINITY_DN23062_c0_g3_i1.p1  ORF type:complete len:696 (-),score=134.40 TRINITY_DN23062_c0_g3_i1:328-2415(-)